METNSNIPQLSLKKEPTQFVSRKVLSSHDAEICIREFYSDDIEVYESFFLLLLNTANQTIGYVKISQGGITATIVDVRLIAKYAVESLATKVVIAHNHPSGNLTPSEEDKKITAKIKNGLGFLDIQLLDHIIITSNSYFSFLDEGLL